MALTAAQQVALERLQEDESLTSELTDATARALLQWGEEQIRAGVPGDAVLAALRAANHSGAATSAEILIAAQAKLAAMPTQPASTSLWSRVRHWLSGA